MILRRLTEHVRAQNWFAVLLDFLIVVVGVFIGIQVSNWNEARHQSVLAADYDRRLRADLMAEHTYATALLNYYTTTLEAGRAAYAGLVGDGDGSDEQTLIAAYRATQYNWYERRRTAFDEIVASSSLALIADTGLRELAAGWYATPLFDIMQREGEAAEYRRGFRMRIEPALQDRLAEACGDRQSRDLNGAVGLLNIDYSCSIELTSDEASAAFAALRSEDLISALRLRNVQVAGRISDLEVSMQTLGMTGFPSRNAPRAPGAAIATPSH